VDFGTPSQRGQRPSTAWPCAWIHSRATSEDSFCSTSRWPGRTCSTTTSYSGF